jgi:3',5'-cyclic AMP phosphodiesterase CpdA
MRTIVHLSDIHFGRVEPRLVSRLLETIPGLAPDLVAVSGDLTQRARRRQFADARAFLDRLPTPVIVVPGNHDVPLYNLAARFFDPLGGYRRHISADFEPAYADDEIAVVGLNSARAVPFSGAGRLNEGQVAQAAMKLRASTPTAIRIVVTHHPFDLPDGHDAGDLIGRSAMAMTRLAAVGADLFLAGHLHVSHVGHTADRYQIAGHSALVVQAGTLSMRQRGELNTFNVIRLQRPDITVERFMWDERRGAFAPSWVGMFRHSAGGWAETA